MSSNSDMEFYNTFKGNPVVLYRGFEYIKHRQTKSGVNTWRCKGSNRTKCPAVLKTLKGSKVVGAPPTHSHESNLSRAFANQLKSKMRDKIREGASAKVVIDEMLQGVSPHVLVKMPKTASLHRDLSRVHQVANGKPFSSTTDFEMPDEYANFILHDSGPSDKDRIIAFGDEEMVSKLQTTCIFGDGTYNHTKEMVFHLFTFNTKVGNSHPPCLYFLLVEKNIKTFVRMFDILKALCPNLRPKKILIDFLRPCMVAARGAFPHAEVQGTYFHLLHALLVKIEEVGLKEDYDIEVDLKLALKSLAALSYVPPSDVDTLFHEIISTYPPDDKRYVDLIHFFVENFIGAGDSPATFPVIMWNHYEAAAEMFPKSTNCCIEYHNILNAIFHQTRLKNVFSLLNALRSDVKKQKAMLEKVSPENKEAVQPMRKSALEAATLKMNKCRQLALQVATILNAYEGESDKLDYLLRLANLQ